MSDRSTLVINLAKKTAEYLDGIGQAKRAEDVRALIRSHAATRGMLKTVHRDNMEIRAAIRQQDAR